MFGTRWRLFRLLGIPVFLDPSWLFILALLTLSLANGLPNLVRAHYSEAAAEHPPWVYWLLGFLGALTFFGCLLLHELGHAVVARRQHMPIRGITLFLFGGVAEIGEEPPSAWVEFLMAIAGPVVSVVLAALLGLLAWLGSQLDWPPILVVVLGYLAVINAVVLIFNLIPAFPLDGGRVLRSILWGITGNLRRATWWAALVGRGFAWFLIAWGLLNFFGGNWLGGIWISLIGLFLHNAAQSSYLQVLLRQALAGESVRRFMNPHPIVVSPELDLRTWVEEFVYRHHRKTFPVVEHGRLVGCIDTRALSDLPRADWPLHTVGEVMRRDLQEVTIAPGADALEALGQMQHTGLSRLLVTEGERLVGIISLKDLLQFLNLKIELEGEDNGPPLKILNQAEEEDTEVVAAKH